MRSLVGLSLLATHGRPSTMITLSAPSLATTHVPTIGSNVAGGRPTRSLLRSTFSSAADAESSKRRKTDRAAPAATPSRGHAKPRRGVSERSRRGWGPGASEKKLAVTRRTSLLLLRVMDYLLRTSKAMATIAAGHIP